MEDQFQPVIVKDEAESINIKDLFFKYVRFLPLIIVSVAIALFAAYVFLRYATPVYESTASFVINDDDNSSIGGDNDKFQQLFGGKKKNIGNEIEVLRSKPLLSRVVTALNLNFNQYLKGKIKNENRYNTSFDIEAFAITDSSAPFSMKINFAGSNGFKVNDGPKTIAFGEIFENRYGSFRISGNPQYLSGTEYQLTWRPTATVANEIIGSLLVAPKGTTGIILLTLDAGNPQLAADILNQLMTEYQRSTIEDKNETTEQTIKFIDDRLRLLSKEVDSVTGKLLAYQKANNLINSDAQSNQFFENSTQVDAQINQQHIQASIAQMIDDYLRDRQNNYSTTPSTLTIADPTLSTLIAAYNTVQLERKARIDANVPVTNLKVKQLEDQLERIRQNILENLRILKASYAASINRLEQRNKLLQSQINALPEKEQGMLEIKRQQQTKQAIYNFLLERREESAISVAATISNIKVLDYAVLNKTPIKPNRRNVRLIALAAGLAIPLLIIFIIEILNDKVNNRNDIEKVTDVPIVGEVGHSFSELTLVVNSTNRSVIAEQFRIIRSNFQYITTNIPKPVILVTSSFSGEGKSFISTNLGAVMALANKKTIILEFDIRKPKIMRQLGIRSKLGEGQRRGITDFLLGHATAEELPVMVPGYNNLYVLPCGPIPPNPSEMLLIPRIDELFDYLKQNFDVVVVDTPPIGMVSDAMTLSRFADCTLYIVRQGHTFKKQLGLIDGFHQTGKLPKIALIINDVKAQRGYGYGGYGKYGYGYGYGYGYTGGYFDDETPQRTFLAAVVWIKRKAKKKKPKNKVS